MTNTLTPEQIAQGWKVPTSDDHGAKKGQIVEIYTRAYGSETHFAEDCDLSNSIDYEDDPVGHFNCATLMYRTFSPDVPGPSESDALEALECLHTYALKTAATDSFYETHNQEMNEHMRVVRDVLAPLPSPPVSGEGVKLEWAGSDLFYNNRHIGSVSTWFWGVANSISGWKLTLCGAEIDKMAYEKGEQYGDLTTYKKARAALEASAREWLSPLTNEPVGVTISREHGHKIHEMLKYYFEKYPTDDDEATALVALSAALGSEAA